MGIDLTEWLGLLRAEYLDDFIRDGGAGVKFITVPSECVATRVFSETRAAAERLGYLVTEIHADRVKIHMMHQLFHDLARQVPWDDLARQVVRNCYAENGIQVSSDDLRMEYVAAESGEEAGPLRAEMRRTIQGLLNRSHELAKDFRYAMLWLCMAQLSTPGTDAERVTQWVHGDLKLLSAVKKLLIYRKIDRHNARAMFSSLGAWCRLAGRTGLAVILDVRQLAIAKRADVPDGTIHYGLPAVMDAYEVLRQLIDATDDLCGIMSVVVACPALFEDEKRGVKVYKALYERVWPDVRLKRRDNPLSALTFLEEAGADAPAAGEEVALR